MGVTGQGWPLGAGSAGPDGIERLLIRMRGLRTIGTVLHVGTHPDDEDAGLVVLMARKYAARVVYWSATRGEAGQNRIGSYSGDALGIYRTWESLTARSIDGGESLFGPFYDFGFCTTAEQAIAKWGRHELIREIVRAIRLVQPQVLVARFTGEATDGHGQHRAVGAATVDAFDAAADPAAFRELGLPAWRTPKFYQSMGGDWQAGETVSLGEVQPAFERDGFLRIDTGEHDPVARVSYQQVAWTAFNSHRSQAMGFLPERGSFFYYYKLAKSLVATPPREQSMFDGLDTTLAGLLAYPGGAPPDAATALAGVATDVDATLCRVRTDDVSVAISPLLGGLARLRRVRAQLDPSAALARCLDWKIASFEDVIVGCLGVDADCTAARAHVRAGERVRVRAQFWNPAESAIERVTFRLDVPDGWLVTTDWTEGTPLQVEYDVLVPHDAPVTTPSWLREPQDGRRYGVAIETFACEALDPAPVILDCELLVDGQQVSFRRPALKRESFPGGYRELPLAVLPGMSVTPQLARIFVPVQADPHHVDVQAAIEREVDQTDVLRLQLTAPAGWNVDPAAIEIPVEQGDLAVERFAVTVPAGTMPGRYRLTFAFGSDKEQKAVTFEPVWMGAPGLPRQPDAATCTREAFVVAPACVDVHVMDATFARWLKYGYVEGATEGILPALHRFGLKTSVISDEEMSFFDLSELDAVVIGANAYLLRDELRRNAARFLDYVAAGGTLIVQYQAYGYEQHPFAPYPFEYNHPHDRVTSADAPVTILEPRHALMTHPNRISAADFDGWTHDRGMYFFGDFDDHYTPILECSDPGDTPRRGGLVVATYGRGAFVYVGYSLFRQIPSGVPGAFRLLANLLALPEALLLERVERLRRLSLFSFMNDAQLMAVARIVSEARKSAGTYLCRQGEVGQELFIVIRGEVEIITQGAGKPVRLIAREGQVVGEFAILADIPRTADLRALTNVHLLVISSVHFRALIREYAEIAEQVIRQLVMKITG